MFSVPTVAVSVAAASASAAAPPLHAAIDATAMSERIAVVLRVIDPALSMSFMS
jgi:hypothetical protein